MIGKALFVFGVMVFALGFSSVVATTKVTYKTVKQRGLARTYKKPLTKHWSRRSVGSMVRALTLPIRSTRHPRP